MSIKQSPTGGSAMDPRAWIRGERGLQTLEWIALALAVLAL